MKRKGRRIEKHKLGQIRMANDEIRKKSETESRKNPKSEMPCSDFELRISDFFRVSSFGFRHSRRLNMHQHVPHARNPAANPVFHVMGNFVRALDGHLR